MPDIPVFALKAIPVLSSIARNFAISKIALL